MSKIYSIKERKSRTSDLLVYEVMVRMPDYKPYPIAVGGREPWAFYTHREAVADIARRVQIDLEAGKIVGTEIWQFGDQQTLNQLVAGSSPSEVKRK